MAESAAQVVAVPRQCPQDKLWLNFAYLRFNYNIFMQTEQLHIQVPDYALEALRALESAGYESWLVGGCVRDAILDRQVNDFDIATAALWPDTERVLASRGFSVHRTGTKHGTVTATFGGDALEITTFRTDGDYVDGRHPDNVTFVSSIEEDLARRDFTINAMAYHPDRGLLDCWGGEDDLQAGVIRSVGDPMRRFAEDGLRVLRACRFSSQLGFTIEQDTLHAMIANKKTLVQVSAERITHELDSLLLGEYVHDALMQTVDVLCAVLPEITACKGFDQRTPYHIYDVWEHIAWVVQRCPATRLARWAALFHDIGKPSACFPDGDHCHFYGHAQISAALAKGAMERLLMSPAFVNRVLTLVRIHDDQIAATPRSVRRALAKLDGDVELFRALIGIKRADALAQSELSKPRIVLADELERTLDEVLEHDQAFTVRQLEISGYDVLESGVPAGPAVGRILNELLEAVIDERVENDHEALLQALKHVVCTAS